MSVNVSQSLPGLSVTHPIRHPWVDAAGRLAFPSLQHWVPSQSSLAAVVAEALSELTGLQHAGSQSPRPPSSGADLSLTFKSIIGWLQTHAVCRYCRGTTQLAKVNCALAPPHADAQAC